MLQLLLFFSASALAQPYPNKPIRMVVAFPPGGPVDVVARLIAPKMTEALGQSVVIENVGGGGGNIAAQRVAKSAADGYTVLSHSSAYAVNPALLGSAGYDAEKDMIPIAVVASQANLIIVHADFPAKTLAELLRRAKTEKLAFASPSAAPRRTSPPRTCSRCAPRSTSCTSRSRAPAPPSPPCSAASRRSARWPAPRRCRTSRRARCAPSPCPRRKRLASLPDVPTLGELGFPGMEDYTWVGLFVPAGTPPEATQKLNDAVRKAVQSPDVKERLEALAFEVTAQPLRETSAYVRSELVKWAQVVKDTGAKPD